MKGSGQALKSQPNNPILNAAMPRILKAAFVLCLACGLHAQQVTRSEASEDLINVDFKDATVREIISDVAESFGIQAVIPDSLDGTTSVKLKNVTWSQVFSVSLSPIGYDFVVRADRVEILTKEEIDALPVEKRRVEIFFQRPGELAAYLEKKYRPRFRISVEPANNAVVFKAHPKHAHLLLETIKRIDTPEYRLNRFPRPVRFPDRIPDLPKLSQPESTLGPGDTPPTETWVFVLSWVDGETVKEVLVRELPAVARIESDLNNALVVTCEPTTMRKVEALVEFLDDKRWYTPPEKRGEP